jgi:hypothetical protein
MASLTLCSGDLSGPAAIGTAAHWDELGLQQLVFGEAELPLSPQRQLIPEVFTTSRDHPCLHDVLRQAAERAAGSDAVLLVDRDLRPSPAMLEALGALLRLPGRPRLAHGRAWRLPLSADPRLMQQAIEQAIRAPEARLDPPERPAWVLLPRRSLLAAPPELSSGLPEAAIWLADQARLAGWRVLEATPACPCLRLSTGDTTTAVHTAPRPYAEAVVEPDQRGEPRLSLLVAAPEHTFAAWQAQLLPAPRLPWELVLRPDDDPEQPGSTVAAWTSGLEVARGRIIWPLAGKVIPPAALLPVLIAFFDQPWLDLALIGSSRAGQILPAIAARQGLPGTVALRREWLERSDALKNGGRTADTLRHLIGQAEHHGACIGELPLNLEL